MITSATNPRIKNIVQLQEKARARDQETVFIIEGSRMFVEAPVDMIEEIYISEDYLVKNRQQEVQDKLAQLKYETVSSEVFRKMSDTKTPQGILCVIKQYQREISGFLDNTRRKLPLYIILEDIRDPGNLGTIFRTGEGVGVNGIFMGSGCVDVYNPKTIRSTMGSIFRVPFLTAIDIPNLIHKLQDVGIRVFAAQLEGAGDYDNECYVCGTSFLIGNEASGLQQETAEKADVKIRIPMEGKVESLNAATAAAVLMYEAYRQRRRADV